MRDHPPAAGAASSRACRIHLVRHGQTIMNTQVRFRGRLDVPLNEVGRAEAREAARALVGAGLVAVYTSPLGRAREVAEEEDRRRLAVAAPLDPAPGLDPAGGRV